MGLSMKEKEKYRKEYERIIQNYHELSMMKVERELLEQLLFEDIYVHGYINPIYAKK